MIGTPHSTQALLNRLASLTLVLLLLTGCTVGGVDVEQEQASGLADELLDGHTFGQTFTLQYDGLYRIDLYTATYARENSQAVIFRIQPSPPAPQPSPPAPLPKSGEGSPPDALPSPWEGEGQGEGLVPSPAVGGGACPELVEGVGEGADLVRLELPAAQISNSGPTVITFPPLADTAGRTLYFSIESPGSVPGDAITIYRHEEDVYPGGQMFVDGQPTGGDVAFIAYTQETLALADVWNDFYSRASQDKPFFTFYCSLLALLLVALVVTLVWGKGKDADFRG